MKPWERDYSAAPSPSSNTKTKAAKKPWEQDYSGNAEEAPVEVQAPAPAPKKSALAQAGDVLLGTVETPIALATSAGANLVAHAAAATSALDNAAFGAKHDVMGRFNKVSDVLTYKPKSESGRGAVQIVGNVLGNTVGKVGEFAGDVAKDLGASEYTQQATRDAATMAATAGLAKGVPKVAKATVDTTKAVAENAKPYVQAAKEIATPERQLYASIAHYAGGDMLGGTLQGVMGVGRMIYQRAKENKAAQTAAPEVTPAQMLAPNRLQGITTKQEAQAMKEIAAERRAARRAEMIKEGRIAE